jgi:hypothetical protein
MMNLELVNLITESGGVLYYVIESDFYDQITVLYNYKVNYSQYIQPKCLSL